MRRRTALFLITVPFLLVLGWAAAGSALAGGGCHQEVEASATEASAATTVKLDGCTFAPTITRVPVGTEIKWINVTDGVHDVVGRKFEWSSQALERGQTYAHTFAKPGVYPYSCSFHPGMAGMVVVGSPATADTADIQQAAAVEPVNTGSSSDGSAVPLVAAGAVGLLGGLALGAVGMRAFARREEAD
jgi:plastocyanin